MCVCWWNIWGFELQGDPTSPFWRRSALGFLWKDWCWSWNSSTLATSCKILTHLKRPWCWEGLRARGEGENRGWDGWMASLTQWMWVWVNPGSWWWTGRPGMLRFMGCKESDTTEQMNWTELNWNLLNLYNNLIREIKSSFLFYRWGNLRHRKVK